MGSEPYSEPYKLIRNQIGINKIKQNQTKTNSKQTKTSKTSQLRKASYSGPLTPMVSAQIGSGVVRGGSKIGLHEGGFHEGCHEVLRGLWEGGVLLGISPELVCLLTAKLF